jgi:hypothetical protein
LKIESDVLGAARMITPGSRAPKYSNEDSHPASDARDYTASNLMKPSSISRFYVVNKRKAAGPIIIGTCRMSLKIMVSRGGLEPPTR